MNAIQKYNKTSQRCRSLIELWKKVNGHPISLQGKQDHEDVIRAAIVLKVAAMDYYFTSKFMEMLIPYIKKNGPTKDLSKFIEESGITFQETLNLLRDKEPYKKIERRVSFKIKKYVTQNEKKIDDLFKGFGILNLCESAEKLSEDNKLLRNVNLLIKRRHFIVHEGDIDSKGRVKNIGKGHIIKKINDIDIFVKNCNVILNNMMK